MKDKLSILLQKVANLKKEEISNLIEIPPNPKLGDYAFPCFTLSKKLKQSPNEIAKSLSKKIKPSKEIERIQSIGPYINFVLNPTTLAKSTITQIKKQKEKYGSSNLKERVIIEYISPNTNKPLHVGHVRNIVLGQAVANLLKFSGNNVKMLNIYNDRGTHICKSMVAYEKFGKNQSPEKTGMKSDHFVGDFYVKFNQKAKEDPSFETEATICLQKWEKGDKKTIELWKKMNSWALKGFKKTYKKFDVKIDKDYYESKIYKEGKKLILEAFKKGLVIEKEEGAIIADLTKQGLGEKVLLRSDGTSIYITQDLYLAILRKKEFNFDKAFYVVANEQDYHFNVLFTLLEILGHKWAKNLHHLSYGMVNLESGKMKSREGNVIDADDLIEEMEGLAIKELESRYSNLSEKEKKSRAKSIAISAIRYYFLKIEKSRDLLFKPKESLSFEGNTGPYLLYTYARAKSILRKSNHKGPLNFKSISDKEKELISQLANFPEIVKQAYNRTAPNLIANYAYQLSQKFNEFYHAEKVIGSKEEQFKLSLVDSFSQVLKNSLSLLGIKTLEKM